MSEKAPCIPNCKLSYNTSSRVKNNTVNLSHQKSIQRYRKTNAVYRAVKRSSKRWGERGTLDTRDIKKRVTSPFEVTTNNDKRARGTMYFICPREATRLRRDKVRFWFKGVHLIINQRERKTPIRPHSPSSAIVLNPDVPSKA